MSHGIWIPDRVSGRAFTKWEPSPSGCRISTYSTGSHGYAQIGWVDDDGVKRGTTAHRAAWVHVNGQVAPDMTIDHEPTCDHRCVHVDHLRELSNFENGRRTRGRDWPIGECVNGHSNDHLVKQWVKGEKRYRLRCSECRKDYNRTTNDRTNADPDKRERKRQQTLASQRKRREDPEIYAKVLADNRDRHRRRKTERTNT